MYIEIVCIRRVAVSDSHAGSRRFSCLSRAHCLMQYRLLAEFPCGNACVPGASEISATRIVEHDRWGLCVFSIDDLVTGTA